MPGDRDRSPVRNNIGACLLRVRNRRTDPSKREDAPQNELSAGADRNQHDALRQFAAPK